LGERREDKQEKDQTIQSSIHSKQTNKQKRGKRDNSIKRTQKTKVNRKQPNRTEANRNERETA